MDRPRKTALPMVNLIALFEGWPPMASGLALFGIPGLLRSLRARRKACDLVGIEQRTAAQAAIGNASQVALSGPPKNTRVKHARTETGIRGRGV
jgi:hypothetical protein